ncbi:MAG: hypothetical protein IT307_21005 [Chloroflexi bacterium]|nr:hypothetical protein [Chloroflexota bacterium]
MDDVGPGEWYDRLDLTLLRFANGVMARVTSNQRTPYFEPDLEVYGTSGCILGRRTTRPKTDGELRVLTGAGERRSQCRSHDVYDRQVEAFNLAVLEGREPSASGLDGLRSVELAEAIVRSAREGITVRLAAGG